MVEVRKKLVEYPTSDELKIQDFRTLEIPKFVLEEQDRKKELLDLWKTVDKVAIMAGFIAIQLFILIMFEIVVINI